MGEETRVGERGEAAFPTPLPILEKGEPTQSST